MILDQQDYLKKIVTRFGLDDAKSAITPLPECYEPEENKGTCTPEFQQQYQSVIGSLLYVVGYGDADGSMGEDRKAVSGYAFIINGGAISWSAKRQEIISLSTTESEYVAATYAAKEALWLRSIISQLFGVSLNLTTLFSDNQSAIALTKEHQCHARTKHIDIWFHFI